MIEVRHKSIFDMFKVLTRIKEGSKFSENINGHDRTFGFLVENEDGIRYHCISLSDARENEDRKIGRCPKKWASIGLVVEQVFFQMTTPMGRTILAEKLTKLRARAPEQSNPKPKLDIWSVEL